MTQAEDPQTPPPYLERARCRQSDPELFWPPTGRANARQRRDAKMVCNGQVGQRPCEVREACGLWSISTQQPDGIWGGMTPRERRQFRPGRAACTVAAR